MLAIEGIPIFYLELAVGQRLRKGAIGVWNEVSPYLAGIGISSAVVSFNVALYYNTIIAWCLFYFVQVDIVINVFLAKLIEFDYYLKRVIEFSVGVALEFLSKPISSKWFLHTGARMCGKMTIFF